MSRVFHPLGYPVRIATRSAEAIDAAAASWSAWRPLLDEEPIEFAVRVCDGPAASTSHFAFRPGMVEFIGDAANRGWFSPLHRRGALRVTRDTVRNGAVFRYRFFDALVLTALDTVAFTPIHAACVSQGGRGVLLCGDSGAGKSSLAYACGKAGFTFVSDDAVHVVRGGGGALVGDPRRVHLRETAKYLFPEIATMRPVRQPNGKTAVEVRTSEMFLASETTTAHSTVFLVRRRGPTRLRPLPREEALAYFRRYVPWRDQESMAAEFDSVLCRGCWRLEYHALAGAVAALGSLIRASAA